MADQQPGPSAAEIAQQQAASRASARAMSENMKAPKTKIETSVSFYRRENNSFFVMPSGKKLVFAGGMYTTDIKEEIDELDACILSGGDIHHEPVPVHKSDALQMREVGARSQVSGRQSGAMNSQTISALAKDSDFSNT